jgi:preprotein translocase subunit YajC
MIQIEWTYALTGILAQTSPAPGGGQPQGGAGAMFFPAVMIAVLVFMFLSMRSQKKREANEREAMFGKLAKNDRVLTIGGVIGTVLTVKDHEVVLKVDETTNTKMTFVKTAIQRVLTDGAGGEKA